jgi:hypothetical protein
MAVRDHLNANPFLDDCKCLDPPATGRGLLLDHHPAVKSSLFHTCEVIGRKTKSVAQAVKLNGRPATQPLSSQFVAQRTDEILTDL